MKFCGMWPRKSWVHWVSGFWFVGLVQLGFGQGQEPLHFQGQLMGGVCASQIHGDGISGFNKFGLSGGVGIRVWRKDERRQIAAAIAFTQKGSRRVPNPKQNDYHTWRYRFTYIDVPILMHWHNPSGWWVGLGLQPSVLIGAEEDFNATGYSELTYVELYPWDLGGVAVAGVEWFDNLSLEMRLSQSLLPISPRPETPIIQFDNFMMNMAVQIMVSLQIGQ